MEWTPTTPYSHARSLSASLGMDRLITWRERTDVVPPAPSDSPYCLVCSGVKDDDWLKVDCCETCWKDRFFRTLTQRIYAPRDNDPTAMIRALTIWRKEHETQD